MRGIQNQMRKGALRTHPDKRQSHNRYEADEQEE